jgi:hypothetical protein
MTRGELAFICGVLVWSARMLPNGATRDKCKALAVKLWAEILP